MDGVSKVHHGGAARQRHDLALGGEYIHRVGKEIDLDVFPELGGVAGLVLDIEQRLQPLGAQAVVGLAFAGVDFVKPMRCHPRLGDQVHSLGAHLKLDVDARWTDQRGVQGLVAVDLGNGDVVLEPARHRFVELVQQPQGGVAVGGLRHEYAKAIHISHLSKTQVLVVHLAVNGIQRLLAPGNAHRHAVGSEGGLQLCFHLF